jgi:bifunctional DNase/RNase
MSAHFTWVRGLATALTSVLLVACTVPDGPSGDVRAMDIEGVKIDVRSEMPVLFLRERGGQERELLIWIGDNVARSIALAMEEVAPPRPNAHDLIKSLLAKLDGSIERVVVTELVDNTFYAVIELEIRGRIVAIDSRPSDAIAVAVRTGTTVYASESLLQSSGEFPGSEDATDIDWPSDAPYHREGPADHESPARERT